MKFYSIVFLLIVIVFVSSTIQQEEDFWNTVKVVETKEKEKDDFSGKIKFELK
jgi:hypothetical protein